jgi:hypothetical protein
MAVGTVAFYLAVKRPECDYEHSLLVQAVMPTVPVYLQVFADSGILLVSKFTIGTTSKMKASLPPCIPAQPISTFNVEPAHLNCFVFLQHSRRIIEQSFYT